MIKLKHRPETLWQDEDLVKEYINSLSEGEVFYDLGACVGYFSMYASKKGLDVYSFEVESKNFLGLSENISANKLNTKIYNIGISDGKLNTMTLMVGQDHIGGHHKTLVTDNFTNMDGIRQENYKKIDVKTYSLDSFISLNDLPLPENLKVDIDGSEYDFLIGSPNCLNNAKSMMIEINTKSTKYEEMMEIIRNYGFNLNRSFQIAQPGCEFLHNIWFTK
jgi:FkbM family methyltransferase